MRFVIIVKTSNDRAPKRKEFSHELAAFNEALVKAGVFLALERLHPSSTGTRVRFSGTKQTVIDGPFAETKELIGGFWLWQVQSKQEAIDWVKRCPNPYDENTELEIEIREVLEGEGSAT